MGMGKSAVAKEDWIFLDFHSRYSLAAFSIMIGAIASSLASR